MFRECHILETVDNRVAGNAAWSYPNPLPEGPGLKGYMAFYWDQMDVWDEERNPIRIPGGSLERELVSTFLRRQEILVCLVLQLDAGRHSLDLILGLAKVPSGL